MKYLKKYEIFSKYKKITNSTYWTDDEIKELEKLNFYKKNIGSKSPKYYHSLDSVVDIAVKKIKDEGAFFYKKEININGKKTIEKFNSFTELLKHVNKNKEKLKV
jgi:hypothetical protein